MTICVIRVERYDELVVLAGPFATANAEHWITAIRQMDPTLTATIEPVTTPTLALEAIAKDAAEVDTIRDLLAASRCCAGPTPEGLHFLNCTQKCQDCRRDPDGPERCRCAPEVPEAKPSTHAAVLAARAAVLQLRTGAKS